MSLGRKFVVKEQTVKCIRTDKGVIIVVRVANMRIRTLKVHGAAAPERYVEQAVVMEKHRTVQMKTTVCVVEQERKHMRMEKVHGDAVAGRYVEAFVVREEV